MSRSPPMVRVYRGSDPTDAYMVRDWLTRNDVSAWVRGGDLLGALGQVPLRDAFPSVWVLPADLQRAEEVVRSFHGPSLVHPEWSCACGEANPASFGSCWSCSADR